MLRNIFIVALILAFGPHKNLLAQADFYDSNTIQEIRITFEESNWDQILDSLFVEGEKGRLEASLEINGVPLNQVGVRYKGFSSVAVDRVKNPFNIKLDYVIDGQKYQGYDKVKLSNVIQDPSFIREVLSYEIARDYMPASKANFANVYINDSLWGLYTNVEAVNKDFVKAQYGTKKNPFFKCNPETLDLNGENSNLNNSPGTDSTDYYPYYSIESDAGWTELYELIETLNDDPDSIEKILNVDRTLWMHAFNYCLVNFDSYIGYAQNYYLYQDDNGQFNPILWDLNMSFGSFRFADASLFWDGFTIAVAKTIDPLSHHNSVSVYPRPLLRNLFQNDTYRRMFLAHMRTMVEEQFLSQDYAVRAQELQTLIDASVANDSNKFYSYQDFLDNRHSTVSDLIDYPGITDLMDARAQYLSTYPGFQGAPTISDLTSVSASLQLGDSVWVNAEVNGANALTLAYRSGSRDLYEKVSMLDDGNHNDGQAGDGVFGYLVPEIANVLQYYFYAENDSAGQFMPVRAAYEYYSLEPQIKTGDLVINEFVALNEGGATDPNGDFEDWIELYNNTDADLALENMYLSDDASDLTKWLIPSTALEAGGYLIVWADGDLTQQGLHANFKLDREEDGIFLSYADGTIIDSISFVNQNAITSTGRFPNGVGPFVSLMPSFMARNDFTYEPILTENVFVFPNPAGDELNIKVNSDQLCELWFYTADGRALTSSPHASINGFYTVNTSTFAPGLYLVKVSCEDFVEVKKVIIY